MVGKIIEDMEALIKEILRNDKEVK